MFHTKACCRASCGARQQYQYGVVLLDRGRILSRGLGAGRSTHLPHTGDSEVLDNYRRHINCCGRAVPRGAGVLGLPGGDIHPPGPRAEIPRIPPSLHNGVRRTGRGAADLRNAIAGNTTGVLRVVLPHCHMLLVRYGFPLKIFISVIGLPLIASGALYVTNNNTIWQIVFGAAVGVVGGTRKVLLYHYFLKYHLEKLSMLQLLKWFLPSGKVLPTERETTPDQDTVMLRSVDAEPPSPTGPLKLQIF